MFLLPSVNAVLDKQFQFARSGRVPPFNFEHDWQTVEHRQKHSLRSKDDSNIQIDRTDYPKTGYSSDSEANKKEGSPQTLESSGAGLKRTIL